MILQLYIKGVRNGGVIKGMYVHRVYVMDAEEKSTVITIKTRPPQVRDEKIDDLMLERISKNMNRPVPLDV